MSDQEKLTTEQSIDRACGKFRELLVSQQRRAEQIRHAGGFADYKSLDKIVIGVCAGDGIGPLISEESERVLEFLLADKIRAGRVELRDIGGLTIEERAAAGKAIPDGVLAELKKCDVILKGPTTTPHAGDGWPNIESANVMMRKELDLFANVRPVKVPALGIDWTFFRENTEGAYTLGSQGINVTDELAVDFTVTTTEGSERIARLAFEFARRNGHGRVEIVTKANVVKTTDGKFLNICEAVAAEYPEIVWENWFVDIMAANLVNDKRRRDFHVFVLPNLYGDILTDEAAEIQGGVGTAGSANIGKRYAMFEAIHGSGLRMVQEGRAKYANPSSMLRATAMLLDHIGFIHESKRLDAALDFCMFEDGKYTVTGRDTGATCGQFGEYVRENLR